jgi:small subunit ribosomal protein S10|tara:strand:- start:422 stop:751 length:330 start_codon:yes stop_codon:yes gene_type:complete
MPVVTTIKLTGENHSDVDLVCAQIKSISDETGVKLRGPIPLPTRRIVVPCRKSPDGEGSETWDRWEMRVHKRLLELVTNSAKDERSLRKVLRIPIPDSVTIELSLRNMG